jgi:hypothetical protein
MFDVVPPDGPDPFDERTDQKVDLIALSHGEVYD